MRVKGANAARMPLADRPAALRLHARPAVVVAGALALGVIIENHGHVGAPIWMAAVGAAGILPVVVSVATRGRLVTPMPAAWAAAGCIAAIGVGGARMAAWQTPAPDDVTHLVQAAVAADSMDGALDVTLRGRVADPPVAVPAGTRVRIAVHEIAHAGRTRPVRGLVETTLARPRYAEGPPPAYPVLELGDVVQIDGLLRAPPARRNPADFDYSRYLSRLGVGATLRVTDEQGVRNLGPTSNPLVALVARVQAHVRVVAGRHVRDDQARAIVLAFLIADRSGIDPETRESFAQTGLTHLLAVSGLHVLLVGLVLYHLLRPTLVRLGLGWRAVEVTRAGVTLAILGVYALVTGGSPSVVRAVVMAGAMVAARTLQRPVDAVNSLGLAGLLLVTWRPTTIFDVGFQLSFAAVAALVLVSPVLLSALPAHATSTRLGRALTASVVASTAATIGTAPVLMVHFGQVPLGGLLLNVPAIPMANAALGASLAMVLAAGPAPWAADAFAAVAELATAGLLGVNAAGAAGTEWSIVQGFIARPTTILASYVAILALAAWRAPTPRWRLLAAAASLAAVGPWSSAAAGQSRPRLDAVFLDVGQGDAMLLSLPGDVHVLVDAGPRDQAWDAGERTVVPHLRRHRVRELDAVVITHPHADHFGGLEAVLMSTRVRRILVNGQPTDHPMFARAVRVADSLGIPLHSVRAGDSLDVGPYARARVVSPRGPPGPEEDPNDGSIVLWVQYGRSSLLLTGDAEESAEWDLVERYGASLRADVVKVGHHGSRTSSTPAFVANAATRGGWAVVQVARRNRYGLPDEEPLERWAAAGTRVALTSSSGAVWLRSHGQGFERVAWRD